MSKGANGHKPEFSARFAGRITPPPPRRGGKPKTGGCAVFILAALAVTTLLATAVGHLAGAA